MTQLWPWTICYKVDHDVACPTGSTLHGCPDHILSVLHCMVAQGQLNSRTWSTLSFSVLLVYLPIIRISCTQLPIVQNDALIIRYPVARVASGICGEGWHQHIRRYLKILSMYTKSFSFSLLSVQQSMHTDIVLPSIFATNGKVIHLGANLWSNWVLVGFLSLWTPHYKHLWRHMNIMLTLRSRWISI